jgi:hypothetical protein
MNVEEGKEEFVVTGVLSCGDWCTLYTITKTHITNCSASYMHT